MLETIKELTEKRESFAIETTLSGQLYIHWIPLWKEKGYRVEIRFIYLRSANLAISRVADRVRSGGHDMPDAVVRRRYEKGWRNFEKIFRDLADSWTVYDNSGTLPVIVASGVRP